MQRNLLPILMATVLLNPLAIDIYLPSIPAMATDFSIAVSEVQSTIALFLFALGVGQIIIGPLTDRFGRRPVALAGVLLYCASSALSAGAVDFHWLQIARVLQGFAACATSIVVFSAVRDCYAPKDGAKLYSYLNGMICIIPALAPMLGGLLAMHFGWRSNFAFIGLYGLAIFILLWFKLPETRPAHTESTGPLYRWARYQPILTNGHFVFYALVCMSGMAAILAYVSYAPVWIIGHLGLSELTFSGLFGANAALNIAACFSAPLVIKRLGNRTTVKLALSMMITAAITLVGCYEFISSTGFTAALYFMVPMVLLCFGFALLLGPATSMALGGFGERAGTATAMLGFIQMSGAALLAGLIQQTSLTAPLAVGLLMFVVPTGLLLVMACSRFNGWHLEQQHG
ncbi:multidrug effflux MFS transporter [Shewanella marina]|uniref:multidrug effflux MFS transporter n=1 Tax=Shewanella marina TaxID=487319 RepID=UPI000470701B|nr:multidrug effflux MFS transporter [Shewanella marina]